MTDEELRQKLIRWVYVGLDATDVTDEEGYMNMSVMVDHDPYILPDYSDTGTAAIVADAILSCPDFKVVSISESSQPND